MENTNITELAEFFPSSRVSPSKQNAPVRIVPWADGETYEEAVKRADDKAARISAQLEKRNTK